MKKFISIAAVLSCLTTTSTPAMATTMVELSTNQMVDLSNAIVRGVITEIWTEEDRNGVVWTRAQLEVSQTLKGNADIKVYIVDQIGGTFGGSVTKVGGTARFSQGEEGIFFLETIDNGRTITVGLSQGKFTARMDPYSQELIAQRYAPPPRQKYDHRFIPLPKEEKRLYLSDLIEQIEDRVEQGWDGKPITGADMKRLQEINAREVTR